MTIGALSRASAERAPTLARSAPSALVRRVGANPGCGAHVAALWAPSAGQLNAGA